MTTLTAAIEPWDDREIRELIDDHYDELALNKDKVPLRPQWDVYRQRADLGQIVFCVLRQRGAMIGYVIMIVAPGLHYATCLTATMDILYVHPGQRDGFARGALLMIDTVEAELRRRGVQRWFMGTKLHKDIGAIFRRRGFEAVETTYTKWIGE